jgi:DNA polymerase-1
MAKAGSSIVCLSDASHKYFRHIIYPQYKANRKGSARPVGLEYAIKYLEDNYKIARRPGLEADDVMGVFAGSEHISDPVIVSIDKDMMTVPGRVLNPNKMNRAQKVSEWSAVRMMFYQALVGDSTDGYPGAKGIGPKKAEKILEEHANPLRLWDAMVKLFDNEEQATLMVRLARILRHTDYNEETGEVRLWSASNPNLWIKSTPDITSEEESKPSITSEPSVEISPETKPSTLETSSSTSQDTKPRTRKTRRKTSRKRSGT